MNAQPATRRIALITGCSSPQGIGFATARALAQDGHVVHATARDHTHDASLQDGLDDQLSIHDLDLRDRSAMVAVLESIVRTDGGVDVLINNAGYGLIGGVEQVDLDRARESFETNFFGTMALIQEILPVMRRQQRGHIINISTVFAAGLCPRWATTSRRRQRSRPLARRSPSSWRRGTSASRTSNQVP